MSTSSHCHKCGAALDVSARTGLCDSCLAKLGLAAWLDDEGRMEPEVAMTSGTARSFGDYELLQEIGRGGMGVVSRARQLSLKRVVALKMIAPERMNQPRAAERFQLEAEAAAKLDHPNIVPIHEIGEHDGRHYYTMKLVEGRSLARELSGKPLPPRRAGEWIAAIARALHYAHERGVLHRDIKPGNILIDSDGRPQLLDFGLAKLLEGDSTLTQTESVMGSPAYMAPEQASGRAKQLTVAADIYSAGAVLYEALTGRPPFRGATPLETMRRVVEQEPERPTTLHSAVDRDLETICLKCLEKEPGRRYPSAAALADDLERWLRHEPIQARRTSTWQRAMKWTRRKPAVAALTITVLLVAVSGLAGILWQWRKTDVQRREAEANLYAADMILAGIALQENDLGKARMHLSRHEPKPGSKDPRGWEWRYIRGQCGNDELFSLEGHSISVDVAFLSTNLLASVSSDGTIRLWDLAARRETRVYHHGSPLQKFRASRDGRLLVANDENAKKMLVWNSKSLSLVHSTRSATDAGGLADFLPDGRTLFFFQTHTNIARLTLGPGEPHEEFWTESTPRGSLACSPDGEFVAVNRDDFISIRNLKNDAVMPVHHPNGPSFLAGARVACFSPDSRYLALQHRQIVHLVEAGTGQWLHSHQHHQQNVSGVVFSPDGRLLISSGSDQSIWFQDVEIWAPVARYRGHLDQIHSIAISPDGKLLATGAKDGSIKIWDARPPVQKDALQMILSRTNRVHFTPDSKRFVTVRSTDKGSDIKVWDTASASQIAALSVKGDPVLDALLLAPGDRVALVRKDERVEILDLATQRPVATLVPPSEKPPVQWALEFCIPWLWEVEDGRKLISVQGIYGVGPFTPLEERGPLSVFIHETATLTAVRSFRFPFGFGVSAGNVSPDGKRFVTGGHDGEMVVFSLEDGSVVKSIRAHGYALMKIDFLPKRRLMATAGMDGYLQIWDTDTWERRLRLRADPNEIYSVAFHPDGTRVATGAQGSAFLTLWDVDSGRELVRLPARLNGQMNRLQFVDQHTLVGWAGWWLPKPDDQVAIWRAPSLAEIGTVKTVR